MTISFPRTLITTPGIKRNSFGPDENIDTFESPITRQKQYNIRPGARWIGLYELPPMTTAQARAWKAWFISLRGPTGTFKGFDPDGRDPVGIANIGSDTAKVKGASQTGSSLSTDGWRFNGTGLLLPGDYFHVGTELKMILEQLDSDGSGNATANFWPPLHISPADNADIIFNDPVGNFIIPDGFKGWESNEFGVHKFTFPIEEDI